MVNRARFQTEVCLTSETQLFSATLYNDKSTQEQVLKLLKVCELSTSSQKSRVTCEMGQISNFQPGVWPRGGTRECRRQSLTTSQRTLLEGSSSKKQLHHWATAQITQQGNGVNTKYLFQRTILLFSIAKSCLTLCDSTK